MEKGAYIAVSGSMAQERLMEVISNNLANVNTSGYKADRVLFETYLKKSADASAEVPTSEELKLGAPLDKKNDASYLVASQGYTDFSQGSLRITGNRLDLAIEGDGFLAVDTGDGIRYMRGGALQLNRAGELVTKDGYRVMDIKKRPVIIGVENFLVEADGVIITEDNFPIAKLMLVDFDDKSLLQKRGDGLYSKPENVKIIASSASLKQGALENSNVNALAEMTRMITAQRAYEAFQKTVQSHDEMTSRLLNNVGR